MNRTERDRLLAETHECVKKIAKQVDYWGGEMSVNGERGLEKILAANQKRVDELFTLTAHLSSRRQLAKAVKLYLNHRPGLRAVLKFFATKQMMWVWIALLASALGIKLIL